MSTNSTPTSYTAIRRKEWGVDDEGWIQELLYRVPFCVMATVVDERPFTVARNFAYDKEKHVIYMHGAQKGLTFTTVENGAYVNLNVSEMGRLLPAKRAMNFGVEYAGVVIFGRASLVTDSDEAKHALQLIVDKHFSHLRPDVDYETTSDVDLKITAVIRIDIDEWSGKQRNAPADFPGAFYENKKRGGE